MFSAQFVAGTQGEAAWKDNRDTYSLPAAGVVVQRVLRAFSCVSGCRFGPDGRRDQPVTVQREITERAIEEFIRPKVATLPVGLPGKIYSLGEPVLDLQFGANIRRVGQSADPVLADVGKKANLSVPSRQPARADMSRQRHLIKLFPRVLQQACVAAQKELDTLCQRVMIFTSSPHGDTYPRFSRFIRAEGESGQTGDSDDGILVRVPADVGAWQQRDAEIR